MRKAIYSIMIALVIGAGFAFAYFNLRGLSVSESLSQARFMFPRIGTSVVLLTEPSARLSPGDVDYLTMQARSGDVRAAWAIRVFAREQKNKLSLDQRQAIFLAAAKSGDWQLKADNIIFLLSFEKCQTARSILDEYSSHDGSRVWLNPAQKKKRLVALRYFTDLTTGSIGEYCQPFGGARDDVAKSLGQKKVSITEIKRGNAGLCGRAEGERFIKNGALLQFEKHGVFLDGKLWKGYSDGLSFDGAWRDTCTSMDSAFE